MIEYLFSLSILIIAVIVIRAICKKRVSGKLVYALWIAVVLRLLIPVNLISLELPFPELSELIPAATESTVTADVPDTDLPSVEAPAQSTETQQSFNPPVIREEAPTQPLTDNVIKVDLQKILIAVWIVGSAVTLLSFAVSFSITGIRLRKSRRFHSMSEKTKVFVTDMVSSPCVMGIVPTIYITPAAEECADLSLIILHEKTHIHHADHLWALLRIVLIIVFWWNPLVWAAALLSKRDAEVACDESVVRTMDDARRITYGRLILDMIPQKGGFVVAFANKPIKYRILRLTGKYKTTLIAAVVAVLTIILCFTMAFISNGVDDGKNTILHFHKFSEKATCTTAARCACGDVKGKPLGHKWVDADCENPKTCSRCSLTDGTPLPHTWLEATCDRAKTCKDCKATMGKHLKHIWISATCTADEYCSLCRDTRNSALGHDFSEATCTAAKTCNRCSYTEGDPLGHIWIDATCTKSKTCTRCQITDGSPLGHKFYFESCTVCGADNTEFKERIRSAENYISFYIGVSPSKFTQYLINEGCTQSEIEYILDTISPDWKKEAIEASRHYTSFSYYYTKEDVYNYLIRQGFSHEICHEITKDMKGNKPNYYSSGITSKPFDPPSNFKHGDTIVIFP